MKEYTVSFDIQGTYDVTVKADNKEKALEMASAKLNTSHIVFENPFEYNAEVINIVGEK